MQAEGRPGVLNVFITMVFELKAWISLFPISHHTTVCSESPRVSVREKSECRDAKMTPLTAGPQLIYSSAVFSQPCRSQ